MKPFKIFFILLIIIFTVFCALALNKILITTNKNSLNNSDIYLQYCNHIITDYPDTAGDFTACVQPKGPFYSYIIYKNGKCGYFKETQPIYYPLTQENFHHAATKNEYFDRHLTKKDMEKIANEIEKYINKECNSDDYHNLEIEGNCYKIKYPTEVEIVNKEYNDEIENILKKYF